MKPVHLSIMSPLIALIIVFATIPIFAQELQPPLKEEGTIEGIPFKKTAPNSILVGWRANETKIKFFGQEGSEEMKSFTAKGDVAISKMVETIHPRRVISIVPILTANSASNTGTTRVIGVWLILEPQ